MTKARHGSIIGYPSGMDTKKFDLEERTFLFANRTATFAESVPKILRNMEYAKQLVRSSGSVAANYIEANESLGKKDFFMHIKICRKEAKESRLWIRLMNITSSPSVSNEQIALSQEALELTFIFASILRKSGAIR